jgi:osmotically-inducible protein OsmY
MASNSPHGSDPTGNPKGQLNSPSEIQSGNPKEKQDMRVFLAATLALPLAVCLFAADEVSAFRAYVDSDLCARLMLGPITMARIECSQKTYKEGSNPVLVQLRNNMVLTVNKEKTLRPLVGQLASVTGKVKIKDGTMKLDSAEAIKPESVPAGDPERRLLDVRQSKGSTELFEKIRHELAMMPYISYFDFISFTLNGSDVVLTGWTVRDTNRSTAYNIVKNVKGVESVVNNIDVLPLGSQDMRIRGAALAVLQRQLSMYFWGAGSDIKIIVKNGNIILIGSVIRQADSDVAFIQCNAIPGAFKVFNLLQVRPGA